MKKIGLFTNLVAEGWNAKNLETGIGGSEEKVIELARELAKTNDVTVFHNGEHGVFDKVKYIDHRDFKPYEYFDLFVSVKSRDILRETINARKIVHWSMDIENVPEWELNNFDEMLCISNYHKNSCEPVNPKIKTQYLWADLERHNAFKQDKEEGSVLYASSFDRGLEELLTKWKELQKALKVKTLYVTYGWEFLDKVIKNNPSMIGWKDKMTELLKQDGVKLVGRVSYDEMSRLYWKSQYWCLPLNNPRGELFSIIAIRSQYCGCIPIVRRLGGLQETVNEFIDWDHIIGQKVGQNTFKKSSLEANRKHALKFNMNEAVKPWQDKIL